MSTDTLVTETEAAATEKQKLAVACILRGDNPCVLDNRNCGLKVVPLWPKTGWFHLGLIVVLYRAHVQMKYQYAMVTFHYPFLRGSHVLKAHLAHVVFAECPGGVSIRQARCCN